MILISVMHRDGTQLTCLVEAAMVPFVRSKMLIADSACQPRLIVPLSVAEVIAKLKEEKL